MGRWSLRALGAITSGAEDGASGGSARAPGNRRAGRPFTLAHSNSKPDCNAWPSHAAPVSGASDRCRAGAILRNHGDSATSPDAQASDASASPDASASIGGEFDPGSGSTLAACLMHASRARTPSGVLRGGRVRNTWATCPGVGDSRGKPRVIPHTFWARGERRRKGAIPPEEGPAAD
jgi:hypothetical protein